MGRTLRWLSLGVYAAVGLAAFGYLIEYGGSGADERSTAFSTESGGTAPAVAAGTLRIGWTAWSDAEVVTLMSARLIEAHFGIPVERVMTDIGIQYRAVANGDLDIMLMGWLPVTHADYWSEVRDRVVNLGPIYTGRLGWVVPEYVPREAVSSLRDLKRAEVARRMGRRIQGIDPGSGLMQTSERAVNVYGLDEYRLVAASGAAMAGVLDRAIRRNEWTVVTAWKPHWIFARYELRFLEDPERVLGGEERIHAIARQDFQSDFPPGVTGFFTRLYLPQDELEQILLASQRRSLSDAVDHYLRTHPNRVRYWLTGEIAEGAP